MFSVVLTRWASVSLCAVSPTAWKLGFCKEKSRMEAIVDVKKADLSQARWDPTEYEHNLCFVDAASGPYRHQRRKSPFPILTWIYAENDSDTYSSPSLAANCMLSSLLSTNVPLQDSCNSYSHKGGFKGRRTPTLQFSPTFTRTFWLDASSCLSFTESWGSPSYRKSTETSTSCQQDPGFMPFFSLEWVGCLFPSQILICITLCFSKSRQLSHNAKQRGHYKLCRRSYHCSLKIPSIFALTALFSWAIWNDALTASQQNIDVRILKGCVSDNKDTRASSKSWDFSFLSMTEEIFGPDFQGLVQISFRHSK